MTTNQRQILSESISLVREGWIQGTFEKIIDGVVCRCASGAISDASIYQYWSDELDIRNMIRAAIDPLGFEDIAEWNDAPGRTQDEVIALLQSILDADQPA